MTDSHGQRHVYLRQMTQGERTSLTVLAALVPDGSRVLDLGTGSGALGAFLRERGCTVDGVTINDEEAALAASAYHRVEVADLDRQDWVSLFAGQRYDRIVCADVLEHLREPERTVAACKGLLAPGGRLLISIPNAGYSGLLAELMQGELRYREEGLLDRTHLRFFTRRSLTRMLAEQGFATDLIDTIERPLPESEFRTRFDDLPPAVARYLLAVPDGSAYQLLAQARPDEEASTVEPPTPPAAAQALFTAQLYWGTEAGYAEDRKIAVAGRIGEPRQTLVFSLRPGTHKLRLDPADRPGFLHLHGMRLRDASGERWSWTADEAGMALIKAGAHQQMVLPAAWPGLPGLVLLHGDDPWFELPVPAGVLPALGEGAALEVDLGWPMSADYLALSGAVQAATARGDALAAQARALEERTQALQAEAGQAREALVRAEHAAQQAARESLAEWSARLAQEQARAGAAEARAAEGERALALAAQQREAQLASLEATRQELAQARARHEAAAEEIVQLRHRQGEYNVEVRRLTLERMTLQRQRDEVHGQLQQLAQHLRWIEQSTVFRATRPIVHAKMALDRWLGRTPPPAPEAGPAERRMEPPAAPVDVIVPVYRGLDDTRCCIESVLASTCKAPWRLVVINDCSPEPEVTQWLRDAAARDTRIVLLENEHNLGFVGTVNRGMALSDRNDVVLLNSDAEVANDWLDRIRAAAYRDARVASVTPFSNNATICSYPKFCEANELPPGWDTARLDRAFAEANPGEAVDVPTGVGFCMYIRRDCLQEVGLFDVEQFGKGYGEENDFCRRAADAGWRNLHALDCFVRHAGGVSFGASKSQRELDAMDKLRRLHPTYERVVHEYVAADPPRSARLKADLRRVASAGVPVVLSVLHNRGGGTLRHVHELASHLQGRAVFFALLPSAGGSVWLELLEPGSTFRLEFAVPAQWDTLLETLRAIGVAHVHYHHTIGHHELVFGLARQLGVSSDFTAHDYFPLCPNISLTGADDRFCGEDGSGRCSGQCAGNAPDGDLAAWRRKHGELVVQARSVLAPSQDTAARYVRMWPTARVRHAAHTDIPDVAALPVPQPAPLPEGRALRVAVLGGMSRIKGADVLDDVAQLAARNKAPIEFHLLGHAYRNLSTQPKAALTVHGAYQEHDLPRLLGWLQPDVVWFPAQWPETYSYTLSACLEAGLPVAGPDLGAFPERLTGRAWSWVVPWNQSAADWLAFFEQLRTRHFMTGRSPQPPASVAPSGVAAAPAWQHAADYLQGIQALQGAPVPDALLRDAKPAQARGLDVPTSAWKRMALSSLVRLRTSRGFRSVARAVPAHVQRRVKNWLLA